MGFSVIAGEAALGLMARDDFQQEWTTLYEACPWATSAQSPAFVNLRCRMYRQRAHPVLVAQREAGVLVGLLTLAVQDNEAWTLGAGCEDGEYHVWLADAAHAHSFMPGALAALFAELDLPPVCLKYVPGDAVVDWTREGRFRLLAELTRQETRVLRLVDRDQALKFVHSKGRLRSKRKGLERLGPVTFRRVVGMAGFSRVLERFDEMSLTRKAVKLGASPRRDPFKHAYLIARQAVPGLQHTTVLELDGNPIAAHIGIEGRQGGAFSLAGITHDIAYDKYSPGALLLAELIPLLCDEGYKVFDLTPGDDAYKGRWADTVEPVYELRLFPSLPSRGIELVRRPGPRVMRKLRRMAELAKQHPAFARWTYEESRH